MVDEHCVFFLLLFYFLLLRFRSRQKMAASRLWIFSRKYRSLWHKKFTVFSMSLEATPVVFQIETSDASLEESHDSGMATLQRTADVYYYQKNKILSATAIIMRQWSFAVVSPLLMTFSICSSRKVVWWHHLSWSISFSFPFSWAIHFHEWS